MHEPQPKSEEKPNRTGIPTQLKKEYETASGLSLDDVRVHYRSNEPSLLHSYAYTQGNQVHIAPGQERHLPHELGHVIQQKRGIVRPTMQFNGLAVNDQENLEKEADSIVTHSSTQEALSRSALLSPVVQAKGPFKLSVLINSLRDNLRQMNSEWIEIVEGSYILIEDLIEEYDSVDDLNQVNALKSLRGILKALRRIDLAKGVSQLFKFFVAKRTEPDIAQIESLFAQAGPDPLLKLILNEVLTVIRQEESRPGILKNPYDKMMSSTTFKGPEKLSKVQLMALAMQSGKTRPPPPEEPSQEVPEPSISTSSTTSTTSEAERDRGKNYFEAMSHELIERLAKMKHDPDMVTEFRNIIESQTVLAHYSSYGENIFPLLSFDAIHASKFKVKRTTPDTKESAAEGEIVTKSQASDEGLGNTNFVFFFLRRKDDSVPSKFGKYCYTIPFAHLPQGAMALLTDIIFPYQGWTGYKQVGDTMVYDGDTEGIIRRIINPEIDQTKLSLRARLKNATLYRREHGPEILHIPPDGGEPAPLPLRPNRDIAFGGEILDALAYRAAIHLQLLRDVGQEDLFHTILMNEETMAEFVTSMITVQIIVPYYAFPESVKIIESTRPRTRPPVEESSSSSSSSVPSNPE